MKIRNRLVSVVGLTLLAASAGVVGTGMSASAACNGAGVNSNTSSGWALESSSVSTCDGLKDYHGTVSDTATDGWKVRVETLGINGGTTWVPTANTGTSLAYNYTDSNSSTSYRMVRADGATASTGANWGF